MTDSSLQIRVLARSRWPAVATRCLWELISLSTEALSMPTIDLSVPYLCMGVNNFVSDKALLRKLAQ
jgi:hypothetical protein